MAESIDELQIDIKVKENKSAQKIDAITLAVNNLTKALSGLKQFSGVLDNLAKMKISSVAKNVKAAIDGKTPSLDTKETQKNVDKSTKRTTATDGTSNRNTIQNLKGVNKQVKDLDKNAKKSASGFSKFTRAIGRIAMYRAIRSVLKGITDAAKQGLENIRSENKALDESMNKISLAGTSLKNSFASMLAPIIQSVEPVITKLADGLARIVNRFTEAKAVMNGMSTYTKILTSDMEEYQKQIKKTTGALLEFDTFTTLNTKDTYTGTTTEKTTMTPEEAESLTSKLENIKHLVEAIGVALAGWGIAVLLQDLSKMSSLLGSVGKGVGIAAIIFSVFEIISNIKDLIDNWDIMSQAQKIKKIMQIVFLGLAGIFTALSFVPALQLWAIPAAIAAWVGWGTVSSIPAYATGGDFQTADLFYANENGQTELIASSNSGGGAVMNMEQLRSAIYEGMVMAMSENSGSEQGVYLDGNKVGTFVAGNVGFRNEANRRNTGLNWR